MKKYIFLLIIFAVGFTGGDVQKEQIVLNWKLPAFEKPDNNKLPELYFDGANYSETALQIPIYARQFIVEGTQTDLKFSVEKMVFEEIQLPENKTGLISLGDEIQISEKTIKSGTIHKKELQIVPVKVSGDKIYLLKSFELKKIPVSLKSAKTPNYSWKPESVLKQGKWIKISVPARGIYKIPYSKLTEWGFKTPASVSVYGSGGKILSEDPGNINYDDLPQLAVWHGKNSSADCLFFYAPGTVEWVFNKNKNFFEHQINDYTTKGYFFLSENAGVPKIVEKMAEVQQAATQTVTAFDAFEVYENELENILPLGSGKKWYGEKFRHNSVKTVSFQVKDLVTASKVNVRISGVGRSSQNSEMKVTLNQTDAGSVLFQSVNTGSQSSNYADEREGTFSSAIQSEQLSVGLKYVTTGAQGGADDNAIAWLDFVEVNFRRKIKASDDALFIRDAQSVGAGNIAEYTIENSTAETKLFDITQWNNAKQVALTLSGTIAKGKQTASELREFAVFRDNGNFQVPELVGEVKNQNIHAIATPELVIVTHPAFLTPANTLANFHRNYDGMKVEVVTDSEVYNEFSSGSRSATGIRNFIKMLYDRNEGLKYVLLFGDGSFDNRNIRPETKSFIPTFQSENSLNPVASFVTDDYFVILDAGESVYDGAVDLGIGRIPASTLFEANIVVDKILNYYSPDAFGEWRSTVCFIGDDEDGNLHMSDSEKLADQIRENHNEFIFDKIYLDAYQQEVTPAGEKYPAVTDAINNRVKDGVLILNYVGHANERFMADEHVLDISNVNAWSNSKNLPIFVTATCEFSRFDADDTSIGEYVLLNPNGGGIGLFSTTRLVFAYSNFLLSKSFYSFVFERDKNGERYRMGDIMRLAKINTINTINKRNFSLLADPALKLSYPKHKVVTTKINGRDAQSVADTISTLQRVDIEGMVATTSGTKISNFNGEISVTVYDKEIMMSTLGNSGETPMKFRVQENIIYKGKANVTSGDFKVSFVVPKDISYAMGAGKIVYYATGGQDDAHGAYDNFYIGGSSGGGIVDNQGPDIQLFMDSPEFVPGDETSKNPTLLAFLSDENGINTVGTGIGHDITAILDDDYSNVLVLNKYYQSNLNDYKSGTVLFPLQNLSVGKHKLRLKAWDVANNSSEAEIEFEVTGDFLIKSVSNYPNPATWNTFFIFEHNQAGANLEILIEIFDQMGKRIDYLQQNVGSNGTKSNPVRWDFYESKTRLLNGMYIYRISAKNQEGLIATGSGKMVVSK